MTEIVNPPKYPYYQYIYNSNGSQGGNRYNSWSDMITAIDGREARIQFEQSETLPAGAWNIDYHTWVGNGNNPDDPNTVTITIETGTTFSSAINWQCQNGLNITSTSTNPVYVQTVPHTYLFDRTAISTENVEFIKVTCAGLVAVGVANGFGLYAGTDDDLPGAYEVFNIDSAPYSTIVVVTKQGVAATFENNTVRSTVPIIYGWLTQSSEANAITPTHANMNGSSINFASSTTAGYFSNSSVITWLQNDKPAWIGATPSTVTSALAQLGTVTNITNASSPYTVLATDFLIRCDTSSGAITLNLPAATGSGRRYIIKVIDATNSVTIDGNSSDTIDGATTKVLSTLYEVVTIMDVASNKWDII